MCYLQSTTKQDRLLKQTCLLIYMQGITPQVQLQCLIDVTLSGILFMDFVVYIFQLALVFICDNVSGVAITHVFFSTSPSVICNKKQPDTKNSSACMVHSSAHIKTTKLH